MNDKFKDSLEALDLQGVLLLLNVLAQRAIYLQMNPPKKKKIEVVQPQLIF